MEFGMNKIYFMVEMGNIHFFTYALNRENAKRKAVKWIGGNPDDYTVTPLTEPGDRIALHYITIAV